MDWYDEIFEERVRFGLRVKERLYTGRSAFQRIDVLDTESFGRVLALDGIFQTSEKDEYLYHEMIAHPALCSAPEIADVLVIGGGDGGTVREVLRHREVERCTMVEIDALVVEKSKELLPGIGTAWDEPRLNLVIGDGIAHVRDAASQSCDVVILDGSDPVGPSKGLFNEAFYAECARVLAPGGVFALQSESPFFTTTLFYEIQRILRRVFPSVRPFFGSVPLYGAGPWSWTVCAKEPPKFFEARAAAIEPACRYYNREIHRAAHALPGEIARRLASL